MLTLLKLKNTDFRWSKRDGPLWAVHIKKKKNLQHMYLTNLWMGYVWLGHDRLG